MSKKPTASDINEAFELMRDIAQGLIEAHAETPTKLPPRVWVTLAVINKMTTKCLENTVVHTQKC